MVDRPPRTNKKFPEINAYPQVPTTYQILEPYVDFAADLEADRVRAEVMHTDVKRSQTTDMSKRSNLASAKSKSRDPKPSPHKPSARSPRQVRTAPTGSVVRRDQLKQSSTGQDQVDVRDSLHAMNKQPQKLASSNPNPNDPKSAFEKAVESLAAMKLHDYALKRKERMRNRYKLWDEIRGTQREMEITGAEQAILEFQEMLAAWKIKYYVQKYRDGKSYDSLDDEKKNLIRQCKGLKKKIHSLQGTIDEYLGRDLEGLSLQLGDEKSTLQTELDQERQTTAFLNDEIARLNQTIMNMEEDKQELILAHEKELEAAAVSLEDSKTETLVVREEMEVTRRACQDYLRTVTSLENKLQDANEDLAGLRSGDMKDSVRLQDRIKSMEADMQELVAKLDMTIEVKNSLQKDLEETRAQLKTTSENLLSTQEGKSSVEKANAEMAEDLEAKTAQIGSLGRLVTEVSVQRDNLKELLSEGTTATTVYKADTSKLQSIIDEKTKEANELQIALTAKSQELDSALRSDEATSELIERSVMNVEDLEVQVATLTDSNIENNSYIRVLEAQIIQARRNEAFGGSRNVKTTGGQLQLGSPAPGGPSLGSAPASTIDMKRMQSPGTMASFYTSASAGNTMTGAPASPGGYFEDFSVMEDSLLTGSVASAAINPLENRLVSLLSLLEDKLGQLDGVVKERGENGNDAIEEESSIERPSLVEEEDSRVTEEDSRVTEESFGSQAEWEDHLQQLEERVRECEDALLEERNRLENTKLDLSDARDEIQAIQREKDQLKTSVKNYRLKYQRKYGRAPPAEGSDAESMAMIEHYVAVQNDMQTRLTEAQTIATEALNYKMECDKLQEDLAIAQDDLEAARIEFEQRQMRNASTRNLQKAAKTKKAVAAPPKKKKPPLSTKPPDMKVVKEEEDDEESFVTANGGSRSTLESGYTTPQPPARPKSNKHYSELDRQHSQESPLPKGRKISESKPTEGENGSQIMSFDHSGSQNASIDNAGSGSVFYTNAGQSSSVESYRRDESDPIQEEGSVEVGPTDSLAEYGSAQEGPSDSDNQRSSAVGESSVDSVESGPPPPVNEVDGSGMDDNMSAYSSLHGASIEGEEIEERSPRRRAADIAASASDGQMSLTGNETHEQFLQVILTRLRYHKQVLVELADEKENCKDAIERWTIYFLKEQGRVPGLADSKYGTNSQVFENFNGSEHDIYAHHTEVQELYDVFDSRRDDILQEDGGLAQAVEMLEEEFQQPGLSLPDGEEYEDAYKLHFESVETLLANGPPDSDDMSITSTNTALTGFFPNGVLDFATLSDVAKLDVLESIDNDIKQFNQDVIELHGSLHEARSKAEKLNSKLNGMKAELKQWHRDYVERHGKEPSDQVKEAEVSDLYMQCHDLHCDLEEEMEKMRTIALISTSKATEVDRLKVLKRRFARRAPASYTGGNNESSGSHHGSQTSLSSSLSNVQSRSRDLSERSGSYMSKDDPSISLRSDASSRSLKVAKESLQKDIAKMSDDLDMLQSYVATADEDIKDLRSRKDECKQAAKQWEEDFIRDNKRKPTAVERRTQVEDLYDEYAGLQEEVAEVLEQREKAMKMIAKIEQSMEHKVNKLGIISEHEGN